MKDRVGQKLLSLGLAMLLPCLGAGVVVATSDLDHLIECFEARPFDPMPAARAFETLASDRPDNLVELFKRCGFVDPWGDAMRWTIASAGVASIPGFRAALTNRIPPIRYQAAAALVECDAATRKAMLPELIEALEDPDDRVVGTVAAVLASLGPEALPAFPALTNRLATAPIPSQHHFVLPIVNLGDAAEPAVPLLQQALTQARGGVFGEAIITALGSPKADPDLVVPLLIETLNHRDWLMRRAAAFALEHHGQAARSAAPVLKQRVLTDKDPRVRWALAKALAVIQPEETEVAVQTLIEVLQDESEAARYSRQHAAYALGELGLAARPALPLLLLILEENAEAVLSEPTRGGPDSEATGLVLNVMYALGAVGTAAQAALPTLQRMAAGGDLLVAAGARLACLRISPDDRLLLESVLDQASSPDAKQCQQAIMVLTGLEPKPPDVRTALLKALDHDQWEIRLYAAMALAKAGPKAEKSRSVLVSGLSHRDSYLRSAVKQVIGPPVIKF